MSSEAYTPGHTKNATDFMSKRTLESHGQYFATYLRKGVGVLGKSKGGLFAQAWVSAVGRK